MAPEKKPKAFSPGEMYSEIAVNRDEFKKEEQNLVQRRVPPYVKYCKRLHQFMPSLGQGATFSPKLAKAIEFLDWDLKPQEYRAALLLTFIGSFALVFLFMLLVSLSPIGSLLSGIAGSASTLVILFPAIALSAYATYYLLNYPYGQIQQELRQAMGYMPEVMGYLIMSLKLSPNIENAVEFAAEHGRGKIADDFKKILWEVSLGKYPSLPEAMDRLAFLWGEYSYETRRALMRIRASILEDTETKRYAILDTTMEELLNSIREKMEKYARDLTQPSMVLFYVGVLLPLILIIILVPGAAFTGIVWLAMPLTLFLVYNLFIPVGVAIYARNLIKQRPPIYEPPQIPVHHPELPPQYKIPLAKGSLDVRAIVAGVFITGMLLAWFVSTFGIFPEFNPDKRYASSARFLIAPDTPEPLLVQHYAGRANLYEKDGPLFQRISSSHPELSEDDVMSRVRVEKLRFFAQNRVDPTPRILIFGFILSIALCFFVFFHFTTVHARRLQVRIQLMEEEFKDSLYVIASRLGENKPMEEALAHVKRFLPNLIISERIFGKTLDNIALLGMPLDSAILDPRYGSLVGIPSKPINVGMKVMVDAVHLGVNVAAKTLINLAIQLYNQDRIKTTMQQLLFEITNMMYSLAVFIAPLVLGVTVALLKVVLSVMASIANSSVARQSSNGFDLSSGPAGQVPGLGQALGGFQTGELPFVSAFGQIITPLEFLIIIGLYVIELAIIITYFCTKIQEDNNLLVKSNIAQAVLIAVLVFIFAVYLSDVFVAQQGLTAAR